jgi:3-isopropylmalate dehydratase small subunit
VNEVDTINKIVPLKYLHAIEKSGIGKNVIKPFATCM